MRREFVECLQAAYREFNVAADRVLTDPGLREPFAALIRPRMGLPGLATDEIMRLLLRCRKAGQLPNVGRSA